MSHSISLSFEVDLPQLVFEVSTPKKHQDGDESPGKGRLPSLGCEKARSQPYWLRETKSNPLPTEGVSSCVCHSLVTCSLSSRLGLRPGNFQPQTLQSPFWAGKVSFLSGCEDCLDVCSLPFSAVSPVDQVLLAGFSSQLVPSLQKSLPPGRASCPPGRSIHSPARKSLAPLQQAGQDRGGGFLTAVQPSSSRRIKM